MLISGDREVPTEHTDIRQHGPKFADEMGKLVYCKAILRKVLEELCPGSECVDVVTRTRNHERKPVSLCPLLNLFAEKNLKLSLSDREGHSVVLSKSLFSEKANAVIMKNFTRVSE